MTIHIGSKALVAVGAVLVFAIIAAAAGLVPINQLAWLGLVLVCPLMMFLMMRGMHGDRNEGGRPSGTPVVRPSSRDDGISQYPKGVS
jgi:hypothetical protein